METQREALAKHGIDHSKYGILLEHNRTVDDETTGIKVVRLSDGKAVEGVISKSRRQLAEVGDTTYIDAIVDLVNKLEEKQMDISHINDINELKALAYDQIAANEQGVRNLQVINARINEVLNTAPETETKAKKEIK